VLMVLDGDDDISHCAGRKGKARQTSSGMWKGDGWDREDKLTISMYAFESYLLFCRELNVRQGTAISMPCH
jgi:hypothetical protein